jgi:HK97 family phage prohead protease
MAICGRCRENRETRTLPFTPRKVETRLSDEDTGTTTGLRGLAIVTDSLSTDLGGFREVIRPSALDRFTNEKVDLRALWSHDHALILGRVSAGTLRAKVTPRGLLVEMDLPRSASGFADAVARRDVTSQSFGFVALDDEWFARDDTVVREVLDMSFFEVSAVVWPAYTQTTLEIVRSDKRGEWHKEAQTAERLRLAR